MTNCQFLISNQRGNEEKVKELTGWHVEFQLVGGSGRVALGEVDNVSITGGDIRTSERKPRRSDPVTTVQGHERFEISFKRGAYNGAIDELMDAASNPLTAPSLQAVATKAYPEDLSVRQYAYLRVVPKSSGFETGADATEETMTLTSDKRIRLA